MFEQGLTSIPISATTVSINYNLAFLTVPEVVHALVQNTSVDNPKEDIAAVVTASDENGFTVTFSSVIPTANYQLSWFAGDTDSVAGGEGVPVLQLTEKTTAPDDDTTFVVVSFDPIPDTKKLQWSTLAQNLARRVSVPSVSGDAGALGDWAVDSSYLYVYTGASWMRTAIAVW